jgi:hypothetical protein
MSIYASHTHDLKQDPKHVADQLGHSVDVDLNVCATTSVESRRPLLDVLEKAVSEEGRKQ